MNTKITFDTQMDRIKWDGTHIYGRAVNRVRHVSPGRSPYTALPRYLHEVTGATRHFRYCVADRDDLEVFLGITFAYVQDVCEKININMAKEVLS